jgi:hypothetical protein
MTKGYHSPVAGELHGFLQFKRSLGYPYQRAEFTLCEFDRFLVEYAAQRGRWRLDRAALAWPSSKPGWKAVGISIDAAVLRQSFASLRRGTNAQAVAEPLRPRLPTESSFVLIFSLSKTF